MAIHVTFGSIGIEPTFGSISTAFKKMSFGPQSFGKVRGIVFSDSYS